MRILGLLLLIAFWMPADEAEAKKPREFAPGQAWSIKGDSHLKAIIGRIDYDREGPIVHITLDGLVLPEDLAPGGQTITIAHAPFALGAFAQSADTLIGSDVSPAPDFEAGYKTWQEAKGGVYTITVSEAAHLAIETIRKGR